MDYNNDIVDILREKLNKSIDKYGNTSAKTLKISKLLDKEINKYYDNKSYVNDRS